MVFAVMILISGMITWWFFYCKKKPAYNGFLWVHPDKGGGVIDITKEPGLQKPFYFNYRTLELGLSFFRQPIYFWKQDKITDPKGSLTYPIVHWEPVDPADFMLQATAKGEPDKAKPYVTPNQLFATTDWSPLKVLETARSGVTEAIKLGVAVIMACVCIFGIIVALDMIGKKEVPAPVTAPTGKSSTMFIQPLNYGGLR
jgi:hypothetical protein